MIVDERIAGDHARVVGFRDDHLQRLSVDVQTHEGVSPFSLRR